MRDWSNTRRFWRARLADMIIAGVMNEHQLQRLLREAIGEELIEQAHFHNSKTLKEL